MLPASLWNDYNQQKGESIGETIKYFKTKSDYDTILHIWNYETVDKHCLPHEK